jgi:hypothetical protein
VKAEATVATDCVDSEKKFHFAIWRLSQWAHVGDEPLPFADRDWPGTVGCLDSAIFGVKQIEGTNGILKN